MEYKYEIKCNRCENIRIKNLELDSVVYDWNAFSSYMRSLADSFNRFFDYCHECKLYTKHQLWSYESHRGKQNE